jgi:hypothetical protein
MDNLKLVLGLIIGFVMGTILYPQLVTMLPEHLKPTIEVEQSKIEEDVIDEVSGEKLVTIRGHFFDEVDYEIIVTFIDNRAVTDSIKETAFIEITKFLTNTSKDLKYAEMGEQFENTSIKYIFEALKIYGITVINVTYNLTE